MPDALTIGLVLCACLLAGSPLIFAEREQRRRAALAHEIGDAIRPSRQRT